MSRNSCCGMGDYNACVTPDTRPKRPTHITVMGGEPFERRAVPPKGRKDRRKQEKRCVLE